MKKIALRDLISELDSSLPCDSPRCIALQNLAKDLGFDNLILAQVGIKNLYPEELLNNLAMDIVYSCGFGQVVDDFLMLHEDLIELDDYMDWDNLAKGMEGTVIKSVIFGGQTYYYYRED